MGRQRLPGGRGNKFSEQDQQALTAEAYDARRTTIPTTSINVVGTLPLTTPLVVTAADGAAANIFNFIPISEAPGLSITQVVLNSTSWTSGFAYCALYHLEVRGDTGTLHIVPNSAIYIRPTTTGQLVTKYKNPILLVPNTQYFMMIFWSTVGVWKVSGLAAAAAPSPCIRQYTIPLANTYPFAPHIPFSILTPDYVAALPSIQLMGTIGAAFAT